MRSQFRRCAEPGCNARVLSHDRCQHHRPRDSQAGRKHNPAVRSAYRKRVVRAKKAAGMPEGWSV